MAETSNAKETRAKIAELFISSIPHAKALGMEMTKIGDGKASIRMPYDAKLIGDPHTGVMHGGAVSALMDTCSGAAVISHPKAKGSTATLDLRIDYFRGATPHQEILCDAECYLMTRSAAFVRATAYDDNREKPVAAATGVFTVTPPKGDAT
ncbi:MAG: PaaI family thioesterase [Pseudoruegeria sp.]